MNKLILHNVSFEVTRKCNMRCGHCMRGEAQNIDMTREMINAFFDTKNTDHEIAKIYDLIFTGGEPTLNANLIIYTIKKIIVEDLPVKHIAIVTNGKLFNQKLMDALNRFNRYRNLKLQSELFVGDEQERAKIAYNIKKDNHVSISFSTDRFHNPMSDEIRELYQSKAIGLKISEKEFDEKTMYKTGLSSIGIEFVPSECEYEPIKGYTDNYKNIYGWVYLTSKGDIHLDGDGSYDYIDNNTIGKVGEISLFDIIDNYGVLKKR